MTNEKGVGVISTREERLHQRLRQLEEKLASCERTLETYQQEQQKCKQDLQFFETMLLEEYHLLLQLLAKDQPAIRLHQLP